MITVGINGNSGSGKSTFSGMLFPGEDNVRIIHVDHIYDRIKSVLNRGVVNTYKREDGEELQYLNPKSLFYKILKLKGIATIYQNLKHYYARNILKKEIEKASLDGVKYLILESYHLYEFLETNEFDFKIFISALPEERLERVICRDKNFDSKLEDNFYVTDDKEIYSGKYDFVIENMGSLEILKSEALMVSDTIKQYCDLYRYRGKNDN